MDRIFSTAGKSPAEAWACWSAMSSGEFYDGDLDTSTQAAPEFALDKALGFPLSLTQLICHSPIGYRRSWQHIRNNRVGVRVVWFVRRGSLQFERSRGGFIIRSGEAGIVDSNAPFLGRISCDRDSKFESVQAIVPPHLFLDHLSKVEGFTGALCLQSSHGQVLCKLLEILLHDGALLSRKTVHSVVRSFLESLADLIRELPPQPPRRRAIGAERLGDIKNYILMNLTDPDLRPQKVAARIGISQRYLHYVLKSEDTCFTEFVWRHRLPSARDRLISPSTRHYLINEVAFMSGFKSAAHFCRMFKAEYGITPGEYREANRIPDTLDAPSGARGEPVYEEAAA